MTDLQLVLIVIGSLIIAAVLIFNWWQERKFHRQIERNFSAYETENSESASIEPIIENDAFDLPMEEPDHHIDISQELNADDIKIETENIVEHEISVPAYDDIPTLQVEIAEVETSPVAEVSLVEEHDDTGAEIPTLAQSTIVDDSIISTVQTDVAMLPAMLNGQIDYAAVLHLSKPLTISAVLSLLNAAFSDYDKPVYLHVFCNNEWILISNAFSRPELADTELGKICCSIQMADRAGAITRNMLNRFQHAVESLGVELNADVVWQSTSDAAADAQALDEFCIEVDKTMSFHLLHGDSGAFTGTKLRGLAEAQGMTLAGDGAFKYYENTHERNSPADITPCFIMFNRDHFPFTADTLRNSVIKSITFQLDIPHVKNAVETFNMMLQIARQMEISLHAQLVDDNNRILNDAQISKIRQYLQSIQAAMLKKGIAPGSDVAHRLFS